ncbi:COQ9 family protein [Novosphingobium sediminicola]|nr:COQ9 family protein [Novosphingobium sediminicola]
MMMQADNLSLDELRVLLAPGVARAAVFDGWGEEAVRAAAMEKGVSADVALYAFNEGAMAMISAWIASIDLAMVEALPAAELAKLPIRERISRLVRFRLSALGGAEESLRRAQAIMARPRNLAAAARLGWQSADAMWRLAGDRAVDFNHYTKRATLAGIYAATLAVFANDESEDKAETLAFLDRRIEGVMRFEKIKGQLLRRDAMHFSPVRLLGRLRYPASL